MPLRYEDIYPSLPILNSDEIRRPRASALMAVRYFQAGPGSMPEEVFSEHHVLLNLNPTSHRVENRRDGTTRDFTFQQHEIVVTPAGTRSGWRWFATSDVIVVTLEPAKVAEFAQSELGMLLDPEQLRDLPQFSDPDLCNAGSVLKEALEAGDIPSAVMFEAMSRIFLVKLLQRYGKQRAEDVALAAKFTSRHYQIVLAYIQSNLDKTITVDGMAAAAGMSPSHFSRVFKETVGSTPMQFVMSYRIEQAAKIILEAPTLPLSEVALSCGFADQAHFSRSFKQATGQTPRAFRTTQLG